MSNDKDGNTGARIGRGSRAVAGRPGRGAAEGGADRHAVRPHRRDADHRRRAVPGDARLLRPDQRRRRGRGLHDQGRRDRQRIQGPAGGRGLSAPKAGRRRLDDALRHADDRGAQPAARGGQDRDDLARFRDRRRGRRDPLSLPVPDRRDLLVAGRRGRPVRQGQTGRQPQGQKDRLHLLRQPGRQGTAADRRGAAEAERGSNCGPSPCRRRASRSGRRCSTSPSATGRIS